MASFLVKIGGGIFPLEDLGQAMNSQFMKLYESHFGNHAFDINNFKTEAFNFFSQNQGNYGIHNYFFSDFAQIWRTFLEHGAYREAERIWDIGLQIAYEWEKANPGKRVHKGTPYYFWGVTCILNDDLDKGFLLMHQALREDQESQKGQNTDTPAHSFVTLDYQNTKQFFRQKVEEIARFTEEKIQVYRSQRKMKLSMDDFRNKFLKEVALQEEVFYFVFMMFRLKRLMSEVDIRLTQNTFGSLLQANLLFNLCLVTDGILKQKNPGKRHFFIDHLAFISSKAALNLNNQKAGDVNGAFNNDFPNTLKDMLSSRYKFQDGTSLSGIEEDLAVAYGFRNFGAHRIEDQPVIYENFGEISQRILNSIFYCIETLY